MKRFIDEIAAKTPRLFAKLAALSVALGILSLSVTQAPADIKSMLPPEVIQGAKYLALFSWAANLFSIAQREYQEGLEDRKESEVTPNKD